MNLNPFYHLRKYRQQSQEIAQLKQFNNLVINRNDELIQDLANERQALDKANARIQILENELNEIQSESKIISGKKLKWLSKNFGLHDPEVLDTLELALPKYKDILRDNEIKIVFNCNLCSEHKIYVKTTYMKEGDFYFVAFGRIKNFDLESCVGSGRYTFEEE